MTKDPKLCVYPFCKRKKRAKKGRLQKYFSKYCTTHEKKLWREKYPMKAAFQTLRQNARRRGKPFTISFEYFKQFCYETKYMRGKGRSSKSYSVDRIVNSIGYVEGNIQKLTVSENARKGTKTLIYDYRHPEYTTVV